LQQIQSLIGLASPSVTAQQAVRSGAPPPVPAGLFDGMLAQAFLGGPMAGNTDATGPPVNPQVSTGLAFFAAVAAQIPVQIPAETLAQTPVPMLIPVPAPVTYATAPGVRGLSDLSTLSAAPVPTVATPDATAPAALAALPQIVAAPPAESPEREPPDEPTPKTAPPVQPPPAADALTAQGQTLVAVSATTSAPTPATTSTNESSPGPRYQPVQAQPVAQDPALEFFTQKAVAGLMAGTTAQAPGGPQSPAAAPAALQALSVPHGAGTSDPEQETTFGDLVKMVVAAEGRDRGQRPEVGAAPSQWVPLPEQPEKPNPSEVPTTFETQLKPLVRDFTPLRPEAQAPQVDTEQVLRQVTSFVKVALDGMKSEFWMQLHPENLGPITVRLTVNDGVVRATLAAQDHAVKAVIQANVDQLKIRLNEQGLRVEHVQVAVGGDTAFGQSYQPDHEQGRHQGAAPRQSSWRQIPADPGTQPEPRTFERIWRPRGTGMRIDSLA